MRFWNRRRLRPARPPWRCSCCCILGTQILNWYWPVLLFAASLALGMFRSARAASRPVRAWHRRSTPASVSATACLRLIYFRAPSGQGRWQLQERDAERLLRWCGLGLAVPARAPRSLYLLAGLFAAAATLFAMRYLVTNSLDLRAPIANLRFQTFEEPKQAVSNRKSAVQERLEEQLKQLGMGLDPVDDHPAKSGSADGSQRIRGDS